MKILELLTKRRILGNFGEDAAAKLLKKKKYSVLARNYVADCGEIDIVAKNNSTIVFVEVKTRTYQEPTPCTYRPATAVNREKQQKLIKCAKKYLYEHYGDCDGHRIRFDVIEVYTESAPRGHRIKDIKHIEAAFDRSAAYGRHK